VICYMLLSRKLGENSAVSNILLHGTVILCSKMGEPLARNLIGTLKVPVALLGSFIFKALLLGKLFCRLLRWLAVIASAHS